MATTSYLRVDVFCDRPFGGNPLAVFPEADELADDTMRLLAREMNLSETVFCLTPTAPQADTRLRIFTVDREVPMAGHPTVGTIFALCESGILDVGEGETVLQAELGVGVLPIVVRKRDGVVESVTMTQRAPRFGEPFGDVELAARALGLRADQLSPGELPIRVVDTGIPWLLIPCEDLRAVQRIDPVASACRKLAERTGTDLIHAFTQDVVDPSCAVHTRHVWFGTVTPSEDPATGSAAGCLGSYLVHEQVLLAAPDVELTIEQGLEIGRPSRIRVRVATSKGRINEVQVGGTAVLMGGGEIRV